MFLVPDYLIRIFILPSILKCSLYVVCLLSWYYWDWISVLPSDLKKYYYYSSAFNCWFSKACHIVSHLQLAGEQHALKFSQVFHLMPTPQGSFYVLNDIFRLSYAWNPWIAQLQKVGNILPQWIRKILYNFTIKISKLVKIFCSLEKMHIILTCKNFKWSIWYISILEL